MINVWDGSFYISRALAAAPSKEVKGYEAGAAISALMMFSKEMKAYHADTNVFVFDHPGTNFRHALYPGYKRNSAASEQTDQKQYQTRLCAHLLRTAGFNVLRVQGVEADDVIASIAISSDAEVRIFTGDKDLQQLVNKRVTTLDTRQAEHCHGTIESVEARYGVPPKLIADFLSLCGDKNDCVPGVTGIGKVKAKKLLEKYGSAYGILKKSDLSATDKESLLMSYKLVKLTDNVKIPKLHEGLPCVSSDRLSHISQFFSGIKMPSIFRTVFANSSGLSLFGDAPEEGTEMDVGDWGDVLPALFSTKEDNNLWDDEHLPTGSLF